MVLAYYHSLGVRKARDRGKRSAEGEKRWQDNLEEMKSEEKEVGKKKSREEGSAGMPVYLGISCVKGGRGERRGGGGGRGRGLTCRFIHAERGFLQLRGDVIQGDVGGRGAGVDAAASHRVGRRCSGTATGTSCWGDQSLKTRKITVDGLHFKWYVIIHFLTLHTSSWISGATCSIFKHWYIYTICMTT